MGTTTSAVRLASVIGLLVAFGIFAFGVWADESVVCGSLGPPPQNPQCPLKYEPVTSPVSAVVAIVSVAGLAFSFLRKYSPIKES
jgi:hypothetical protein